MRYLVDTHILLWSWHDPSPLTTTQVAALNADGDTFVSMATVWEIAIKVGLGKLTTLPDVAGAAERIGHILLPITVDHTRAVQALPLHHRDPSDRMLVAQAQVEGLTILSADTRLKAYGVEVI